MADSTHLEILKEGADRWNLWRRRNPGVAPDLSGAILWKADLRGANLSGAILLEADLSETNLSAADLSHADLSRANLTLANLSDANLIEANLRQSLLLGASFVRTRLADANFHQVDLWDTLFIDVDLSQVRGLETIHHHGPSFLDLHTVSRSPGKIPEIFLRGCGLSNPQIESAGLAPTRNEPGYYSCFISYSSKDETFVKKLHDDLQNRGVRCWFAPKDLKIGDRLRPRIDQEIRLRDKLLVVLSENAIQSEWVGDEVEAAIEEERNRGKTILFPIRLDAAVLETREDWAAKIKRRRHIGDFSGWAEEGEYIEALERLLRDLQVTDP